MKDDWKKSCNSMSNDSQKVGSVLVLGGGIGGMQASLDLADAGFKVYLLEDVAAIGGRMAQLDKTFPTNDCSMCIMAPRLVDVQANLNIDLLTNSEITYIEGSVGKFNVTVLKHPRYVDEEKCTGCGECTTKCPVKKPDEYNAGLSQRRNIYIPYAQAVPLIAKIDKETCTYFIKGKCKVCEKICKANAIDYEQKPKEITLEVGSIILAAGFEPINPDVREEYGYGYYKNVITSLEFERYLSASGPTAGHIKRPSDDKEPKKIAWIQCVGSRDEDRKYCSSVCCMYATKEAIIAKEHNLYLDITIFFMDVRAFGKGFDNYYERAKEEYGVRYVRCMVSTVKEHPKTKNLIIRYVASSGKLVEEEFDMVVLSVGLKPSPKTQKLAQILGIELNQYNFCSTSTFTPIATSKEGIYVCGVSSEPKDIPETVMQASGAAACVGEILGDVRGSMITKKEYPQEIDVSGLPPRIGVFVCRCGINIAAVVDVPAVTEYAKTLPNVVCVEEKIYLCSQDAQSLIKEKIKEHDLNRVVVASCTPRTHERLFQDTIREAGLNKYLFEMANIRDQCSWVHGKEPDSATQKAKELVKMSVARAGLLEPLQHTTMEITHKALVIGGGLSGMTAALSLSEQGFEVHIVEKEKELGGNLRYVYFTLDGSDVQAYLKSLIQKVKSHHLIKLHLSSQLTKISGHVGYFKSEIRNPKSEITIEHGIVIVATGGVESKPTEYLYGQDDRILTQRQLEEQIVNPKSEIRNPKSIVMIQCVGSRDDERPYCSRICCSQAVKNALKLKEKNPDIQVYILYRDMRTYGFREDYYSLAREAGVIFIRYDLDTKPVVTNHGPLKVRVKEPVLGEEIVLSPDIVVLAPAIVPHPENEKLASLMKVTLNAERFFLEAHLKLRPVDFAIEGMFLCGLAHSPKDISESIAQAQAAAGRAATILAKDHLEVGGVISTIDEDKCVACLTCIRMCPYDVPFINTKGAAEIESAKCQGCGICAAECPAKAIQLMHYKDNQLLAKTEALFA